MLFVERSNRTEILFEGLAERLAAPGRDPLARAVVVVQGAGMERWLAQRLARKFGVCANVEFPFPRPFLEGVFEAVPRSAGEGEQLVWDLERMTWAIARAIDGNRSDPVYASLVRHLDGEDADWRLVALARQIANVFDQYITYRPDWTLRFEAGEPPDALLRDPDVHWQIALFRALRTTLGPGHMADRARAFLAAAGTAAGPGRRALAAELERRFAGAVEIFAVSTLPPLHLEIVRGLARFVDVRLSVLTPSRVWYSELWRELRDEEAGGGSGLDAASIGPVGALLAGLGRLGADFQRTLEDGVSPDGGDQERFVDPSAGAGDPSLLCRLQAQLLDLEPEAPERARRPIAREDDSIRIHLCHGPRRELEVVESVLRAAFERDPSLEPEDVIVMAPDIDAIAADVDAVFGPGAEDGTGIPYRIADRGAYRRSPVAEAFRALLSLVATRLERSAVLDWLALPDVAARFGLDEAAVAALADWAIRAGYRFALDEGQRASLGLPPDRGHTLAGSLDRLVLAHAFGETEEVVRALSPIGLDAFAEPAWLGAIAEVEALLRDALQGQDQERSVVDWIVWLEGLLERSVSKRDTNSHEHLAIRDTLARVRKAAVAAGFVRPLGFDAIRERVVAALEESPSPQAFLAGGVTFCQLVPLRAIPFRIVVITGLVDGGFPRRHAAAGFDAMTKHPRAGDRGVRDDDRHLFLEALLSAREKLVLTVPAYDPRSGQARPSSIVVSELVDALDAAFMLAPKPAVSDARTAPTPSSRPDRLRTWLVVPHPLQATSPRYFEGDRDPRLVARSARAHRGALARQAALAARCFTPWRFLPPEGTGRRGGALEGATEAALVLTLDELIERVLRSTRFFAREVLALRLPRPEEVPGDLDPVSLSSLETAIVGRALLADLAAGVSFERAIARMRADPRLPVGIQGELVARDVRSTVQSIAALEALRCAGARLPDRPFELGLPARADGVVPRIVGRLDRLWSAARVEADYGRMGGDAESRLWIRHLVLCALAAEDRTLPRASIGIGRPPKSDRKRKERTAVVELDAVEAPLPILATLFDWATSVADAPLPLFERASRTFAEKSIGRSGGERLDDVRAWRDARFEFEGREDSSGVKPEAERSLETMRVWEGLSPIEPAGEDGVVYGFDELARAFFEPMFRARRSAAE